MTVAYAFFKYNLQKENQCLLKSIGAPRVPVLVSRADPTMGKIPVPENAQEASSTSKKEETRNSTLEEKSKKCRCGYVCMKILYIVVAGITILQCIAVIIVAVTSAVASKIYHADQSGRTVALVILIITAFVTMSIAMYASIGLLKKHGKPLHLAAIILFVLLLIQAILAGASFNPTAEDVSSLSQALSDSFSLSRAKNTKHHRIWANTQHDLDCCGVTGPEDYRSSHQPLYFSPNVPISCCPAYDPDRSELLQERQREDCRAKNDYYNIGCREEVIAVFKETGKMVLSVSIGLIICEFVIAVFSAIMYRKQKKYSQRNTVEEKA